MSKATYTFTVRKSNSSFKPELSSEKSRKIRVAQVAIAKFLEAKAQRAELAEAWQ